MNPLVTSSTSPTLRDPIDSLPPEIFIKFLKFLPPSQLLLRMASTSSSWRDCILSTPSLFNRLEIGQFSRVYHDNLDPASHRLASNRLLKQLVGYSNLAHNKLVYANLEITSFLGDPELSLHDFNATNLSSILSILHFSSNHLKTLELELIDVESNVAIQTIYITNFIKSLESFQVLRKVVISSDLGIKLESGSMKDSKTLKIDVVGFRFSGEVSELHQGRSSYKGLIEQVTEFTGKGIERIKFEGLPEMSSLAFRSLQESTESLENVNLFLQGMETSTEEIISFLITCPNLRDLSISSGRGSEDEEEEEEEDLLDLQRLEFRVPYITTSNLRSLVVKFSDASGSKIVLDEAFFSWAGGNCMERFEIYGDYELQRTFHPTDPTLLRSFLKILRRTIKTLIISGIYLRGQTVSNKALKFIALRSLSIMSNIEMVEEFSRCHFTCLVSVAVSVLDEKEISADTHRNLVQIIKRCKKTLRHIVIRAPQIEGKNQVPESEIKKPADQHPFSLLNVTFLALDIDDESISEFYLPIRYPKLTHPSSHLHLAKGSKLSQASFNQTQSSIPASDGVGEVGMENPQTSS